MSIQGDRVELAAILSTIDGVTGSKYRPNVIDVGSAWPLLGGLNRGEQTDTSIRGRGLAGSFQVNWRVVIVLPENEEDASEWFDTHHEEVADALLDFGYVTSIDPGTVGTEAGEMEAMIVSLRKEA